MTEQEYWKWFEENKINNIDSEDVDESQFQYKEDAIKVEVSDEDRELFESIYNEES